MNSNGQLTFADLPPACLSRRTDPATSAVAGRKHETVGRAHSHRTAVLAVVSLTPGLTYREIAKECNLECHEVEKRLNDLRLAGAVAKGPPQRCTINGNMMTTWNPAPTVSE